MPYKHDYDKTLTRLTTIIKKLNDGESLSVKELAEEFNVSDRTIQRDFNLRLVNLFPIYQEKRRWKMQDDYKIEKAKSVEDTIVLDILEKMSDGLGSTFSTKTQHMLSKIRNEEFNPIYAKLNMEDISDSIHNIALLEDAIKSKKNISYLYDLIDYKSNIEVKPLKIANFEGIWYLIALDARNDKLKKYHLKSISDIKILDTIFKRSKDLDKILDNAINVWFNDDQEAFEVILYLDKHAAKTLKRKPISNSQRVIKEYKDGSCDISLMITHQREVVPIIQYWLPRIKVVSPQSLSDFILNNCKKFIEEI